MAARKILGLQPTGRRSRWGLIGKRVRLLQEFTGNDGEVFAAGTELNVSSEPTGNTGDGFNLAALDMPPNFDSNGAWRGCAQVPRRLFEVVGS